ncbi:MAG: hypothetical protein K0R03_221 [Moraxellaceae bacterium]|jgi:hypothetical protein|nr:hypothetical protein [Moraxellaceae bacterium]MDF3029663.1 hypothetical protein [Moraxellaceae bacterium]
MPSPTPPNLTEKLRRQEEKARNDRERHLRQLRERGDLRGDAATGANPLGGRTNLRERDK